MRNKLVVLFHLFIIASLFFWNVWIYTHRNKGYAYKEYLSYNSLYILPSQPILKNLELIHTDSARIQISVINRGKEVLSNFESALTEGRAHYAIDFEAADFGIDYTSGTTFKKKGSDKSAALELFYSNIPYGNFKRYDLSLWQYSSPDEENELLEAKKIISDNTDITKARSDIEKIEVISTYLIKSFANLTGLPKDSMEQFSPLKRFNYAVSKRSKIWCGDMANILALFLKSEGISSRLVCTEGELGDLRLGGHSMIEAYAKELNKWILVDLTSKAIFMQYNKNPLNIIELFNLHQNQVQNIEVTSIVGDSTQILDYRGFRDFYSSYFTTGTQFVYYFKSQFDPKNYSFWRKWKRYFWPSPTFASYAGTNVSNNDKFYTKQTAFLAFMAFSIYSLTLLVLKKVSKPK